jgi:tRNA G18 (ribose-2'-O)-methylase SpoU
VSPLNKDINQGGLIRLAEEFRLDRVDYSPEEDGATDFGGSRGTQLHQSWKWNPVADACREAKTDGYHLVAVTLSSRAVDFATFDWQFPLALVIGSELRGIPPEIEAECEASVAIPLFGMVQSLNVVCATGIVLESAMRAYTACHPDFLPARQLSRNLISPQN